MSDNEITIEKVNKTELCHVKLRRERGGIVLYVKSEIFEEYFAGLAAGNIKTGNSSLWGMGMKYYSCPSISIANDGDYSRNPNIMQWGTHNLIDVANALDNFSFIRAVGIKDGIEITYPGLFLAKDIEKFKDNFKTFIKKFYVEYMKVSCFEITVSTSI